VLTELDRRRATAWQLGRPELLGRVYVPGSAALRRDRQMLTGYVSRGLWVTGAGLDLLDLHVVSRAPGLVSLLVVDRLRSAVAHNRAGDTVDLPRDRPTRHRIDLRRQDGRWRIARISLARPPAAGSG
jgi:hypothetical protein